MHIDYTISLGTILHLLGLLIGLFTLYSKLDNRMVSAEVAFQDAARRLEKVEHSLETYSRELFELIGSTKRIIEKG